MPKKLNDTQVLELVTRYANGTSISALAKDYGISRPTATKYIEKNAETLQKVADKKSETVTEWLKAHTDQIQGILNMCIDLLPEQLKKASARDIVGVYKVLTETNVNIVESKEEKENQDNKIEFTFEIKDLSGGKNNEG